MIFFSIGCYFFINFTFYENLKKSINFGYCFLLLFYLYIIFIYYISTLYVYYIYLLFGSLQDKNLYISLVNVLEKHILVPTVIFTFRFTYYYYDYYYDSFIILLARSAAKRMHQVLLVRILQMPPKKVISKFFLMQQ
jgi:hypothetical protein